MPEHAMPSITAHWLSALIPPHATSSQLCRTPAILWSYCPTVKPTPASAAYVIYMFEQAPSRCGPSLFTLNVLHGP